MLPLPLGCGVVCFLLPVVKSKQNLPITNQQAAEKITWLRICHLFAIRFFYCPLLVTKNKSQAGHFRLYCKWLMFKFVNSRWADGQTPFVSAVSRSVCVPGQTHTLPRYSYCCFTLACVRMTFGPHSVISSSRCPLCLSSRSAALVTQRGKPKKNENQREF